MKAEGWQKNVKYCIASSAMLYGIGLLLVSLFAYSAIPVILRSAVVVMSTCCAHAGLCFFIGRRPAFLFYATSMLLIVSITCFQFLTGEVSPNISIITTSSIRAIIAAHALLLMKKDKYNKFNLTLLRTAFAFLEFILVIRMINAAFGPEIVHYLRAEGVHAFYFIGAATHHLILGIAVMKIYYEDEEGRLKEQIDAQTHALRGAKDVAEQALQSLGQTQGELIRREKMAGLGGLVAGIAHEVNTPIGATVTVASTLENKAREFFAKIKNNELPRSALDAFTRDVTEATGMILRNLHDASTLIRNFKQVAVDQTSERRRRFDCLTVTTEVVSLINSIIKNYGVRVFINIPENIVVDSYPGAFGQVINNILINACCHAYPDGSEPGSVVVSATENEDSVTLSIADDGVGIGDDVIPLIFDPFFTTKLGLGGSGLGLYLVYNIVTKILCGQISVTSRPHEGATFTVTLPKTAPTPETF